MLFVVKERLEGLNFGRGCRIHRGRGEIYLLYAKKGPFYRSVSTLSSLIVAKGLYWLVQLTVSIFSLYFSSISVHKSHQKVAYAIYVVLI